MLRDFKQFLLRGNVVDLAVAVITGAAFGAVVTALVADFITPLIAAVGGQQDFSALTFSVNGSVFRYGHFLNQLLAFVMIAAVVFFFVVRPINWIVERSRREPPVDPTTKKCSECLSEVPLAAKRCAFCTSVLAT
jgi:large conductance mechanosensitive channel